MNVIPAKVREQLDNASQSHLLLFWDELSASQRTSLLNQIDGTDLKMLDQIWRSSINDDSPLDATARIESAKSPGQVVGQPQSAADIDRWKQATRLGERELEAGSVAVITVAGGQGSRLGFDHPKGMFPIGPKSDRTLFQIFAEQILARRRRHRSHVGRGQARGGVGGTLAPEYRRDVRTAQGKPPREYEGYQSHRRECGIPRKVASRGDGGGHQLRE